MTPITVLLADDHTIVRQGLRALLEMEGGFEVVGEAANGLQAVELALTLHPAVVVLDLAMPHLNGLEACRRLSRTRRGARVIILSMYDDRTLLEKALDSGVMGYVLKENAAEEVIHAIEQVYKNQFYISPKLRKYMVPAAGRAHNKKDASRTGRLTQREREVLQMIAEGASNKEIAHHMGRTLNTVLSHRKSIMRKLDIHNEAMLVRYALRQGISHL